MVPRHERAADRCTHHWSAEAAAGPPGVPAVCAQRWAGREQVCQACAAGLDPDGASLSLLTARSARGTLYATDATAESLEDLQFSLGEGVCVEAALTGRPVLVPDLHDATEVSRWPMFAVSVMERHEMVRCSQCRCSGERSTSGCWTCIAGHRARSATHRYGTRRALRAWRR